MVHTALVVVFAVAAMFAMIPGAHAVPMISVYVRVAEPAPGTDPGVARANAERAIAAMGGTVTQELDIVGGFVAMVPANDAGTDIAATTLPPETDCIVPANGRFANVTAPYEASRDPYSLLRLTVAGGNSYSPAFNGQGIDVALIDTGVAPVGDFANPSVVIHGPDFSFDSQSAALRHNDAFGHGTHMAGIIHAVAPSARIVSLKVGDRTGATDITQVIAALDWARAHKNDFGMNIRVVNLAYGTLSLNSSRYDQLSAAVDRAWQAGMIVTVSAGNVDADADAADKPGLLSPAYNQNVLAVGAFENDVVTGGNWFQNSRLAGFSSSSTRQDPRTPDVGAPGSHIASLRVPGSLEDSIVAGDLCDPTSPYPIVGNGKYIRGSGTSQATAFASGVVAQILSRNPLLSADGVKRLLKATAHSIPDGKKSVYGDGAIDRTAAYLATPPYSYTQSNDTVYGGNYIETTRNGTHVLDTNGVSFAWAPFTWYEGCLASGAASGSVGTSPVMAAAVGLCDEQTIFAAARYSPGSWVATYSNSPVNCAMTKAPGVTAPLCANEVWRADNRVWTALPARVPDPSDPTSTTMLSQFPGSTARGFVADPALGLVWPAVMWGPNWANQPWPTDTSTSIRWGASGWMGTSTVADFGWERSSWRLGSWRGTEFSSTDFERSSWRLGSWRLGSWRRGSWRLGSWREFGYR
jgi:serine protease AprX